jgi:hypothetical protein
MSLYVSLFVYSVPTMNMNKSLLNSNGNLNLHPGAPPPPFVPFLLVLSFLMYHTHHTGQVNGVVHMLSSVTLCPLTMFQTYISLVHTRTRWQYGVVLQSS